MFFPREISSMNVTGEFRTVQTVFISFKENRDTDIFILEVLSLSIKFKGYLNKVIFGDKGSVALVIFGAPTGIEKPEERALRFSETLNSRFGERFRLRFGISSGLVFAGFIGNEIISEYSVLGAEINLASRIMERARYRKILTGPKFRRQVSDIAEFLLLNKYRFKGFKEKVPIFEFLRMNPKKVIALSSVFLGREEELKSALRFIDSPSPLKTVYLDGVAGIGKTAFANELKRRLNSKAYFFLRMTCDGIVKDSLNPFKSMLNEYFHQSPESSDFQNKRIFEKHFEDLKKSLLRIDSDLDPELFFHILAVLLGLNYPNNIYDALDSKSKYTLLLSALELFFRINSLNRTLVIEIEDAENIDSESLKILNELGKVLNKDRIIFIIVSRIQDDGGVFKLNFISKSKRIYLGPLSNETLRNITETIFRHPVSDDLFRKIISRAEGNPFFLEQIGLYLLESGVLILNKGRYILGSKTLSIPDAVNSIIISRIDRLESDLKEVVKTASIFGKEILIPILKRILRRGEIDNYLTAGLEESIWEIVSEMVYIFKHALIREAAYEMQLKKTLKNLHNLAGEIIEDLYRKKVKMMYADLVYHYENAGNKEKTIYYLNKLADQEKINFQNIKAIENYQKLLTYRLPLEKKAAALINLSLVYMMTGEVDNSERYLRKALRLTARPGFELFHSRVLNKYAEFSLICGRDAEAFRYAKEAYMYSSRIKAYPEKCDAILYMSNVSRRLGKQADLFKYCSELMRLSEKNGYLLGRANALVNLSLYYRQKKEFKSSVDAMKEAVKIYRKIKNYRNLVIALGNLGLIYRALNLKKKSYNCFRENIELSKKIGYKSNLYLSYS
ncbi:MAG TPA: tetratricopeptide repeat protein, partial [Firmicutes bacterium]|nr:tetratricopeptide repeat protein [Bacillota bacterium]